MNSINNSRVELGLSVIVPLFNEEENITIFYQKLKAVLEGLSKKYEIIFIDDGSSDNTYSYACDIQKHDSSVRVIKLRKNFGQTAALSAGIDLACGDVVITMDGDLQNNPEEIPKFLKELEKGFDVVCSWRKNRRDPFLLRVLPSKIANAIIKLISGIDVHDFGGTYRAYRKEIIKKVELFGDAHRFIPALSADLGASVSEVVIESIPRKYGQSHYGISRAFGVALDLILLRFLLGYLRRPLRFFGFLSILTLGTGFLISAILLVLWLLHVIPNLRGNIAMLTLSVFLMTVGVQFLVLGILAELIARIYFDSKGKKIYEVSRII